MGIYDVFEAAAPLFGEGMAKTSPSIYCGPEKWLNRSGSCLDVSAGRCAAVDTCICCSFRCRTIQTEKQAAFVAIGRFRLRPAFSPMTTSDSDKCSPEKSLKRSDSSVWMSLPAVVQRSALLLAARSVAERFRLKNKLVLWQFAVFGCGLHFRPSQHNTVTSRS